MRANSKVLDGMVKVEPCSDNGKVGTNRAGIRVEIQPMTRSSIYPWYARCVDHDQTVSAETRDHALALARGTTGWCPHCMTRSGHAR